MSPRTVLELLGLVVASGLCAGVILAGAFLTAKPRSARTRLLEGSDRIADVLRLIVFAGEEPLVTSASGIASLGTGMLGFGLLMAVPLVLALRWVVQR